MAEIYILASKLSFCSFVILSLNRLIENYIYFLINWCAILGAD